MLVQLSPYTRIKLMERHEYYVCEIVMIHEMEENGWYLETLFGQTATFVNSEERKVFKKDNRLNWYLDHAEDYRPSAFKQH